MACGDIAIPIAWTALPNARGSGSEDQVQVVEAALESVDPALVDALVADRVFISAWWLRRLQAEEVPVAIRLRSDRRVALQRLYQRTSPHFQHACSPGRSRPARSVCSAKSD